MTDRAPQFENEDEILIEVTEELDAANLVDRLRPEHAVWVEDADGFYVIGAAFAGADELARLLRKTEVWVAVHQQGAVRYHLDGKAYVLHAPGAAPSSVAA